MLIFSLIKSTTASIIALTMLATSIISTSIILLFHLFLSIGTNNILFTCGIISFILFLIFLLFYPRNIKVLGIGAVFIVALIFLLIQIDVPYIVFELNKNKYLDEVETTNPAGPTFIVFDYWKGEGMWEWIIFDSTDQIGLPENKRTEEWKSIQLPGQARHNWYASRDIYLEDANGSGHIVGSVPQCNFTTRYLEHHFFYVTKHC